MAKEFMIYEESLDEIDRLYEEIALYTVKASALLAKERGAYPYFKNSMWDRGVFFQKIEFGMKKTLNLLISGMRYLI